MKIRRLKQRLKYAAIGTMIVCAFSWVQTAYSKYTYKGIYFDYEKDYEKKYSHGRFVEYTDNEEFCHSWVVSPGTSLLNEYLLAAFYGAVLIYIFLGVAIVSDVFME